MLKIEDLSVEIDGNAVLEHIDLEVKQGETHILFGPNGSGKTTLLMTIMGYPQYKITGGHMYFKGTEITYMPIDERARLGIGISYQRPPTIHGVKTAQMVRIAAGKPVDVDGMARRLNFDQFLERDINDGFSGGEIKRSELLQLMAQNPDLLMFDEPESGVDMENIALVGKTIAELLGKTSAHAAEISMSQARRARTKLGLVITHTGHILNYVAADVGHVLYHGRVGCSGNPREMLDCISSRGYEECIRCSIGNI